VTPKVLIISGWAHGLEAIKPMGDALADRFEVKLLTGAHVLSEQTIPRADYIVTGSMGGLLAMELLPEYCKKLVLISSTAKFCAGEDYPSGTPEKVLRRMILQLKRNPDAVLEEFFKNVHYPHRQSRQAQQLQRNEDEDLVAGLEYLRSSDVRARVPEIKIPVLLLHGENDRIIPPTASEWLHGNLSDSRLKIYKNDGHALPAHHFGEVMKAVSEFLSN
jgi:pimeloyl-[acyl-carrier protein] methyl ester esterase